MIASKIYGEVGASKLHKIWEGRDY